MLIPQYVAVAAINSAVVKSDKRGRFNRRRRFRRIRVVLSAAQVATATQVFRLQSIASMGGFIWVLDKRRRLLADQSDNGPRESESCDRLHRARRRINATNGANWSTDSTGATPITGTTERRFFGSHGRPRFGQLYLAECNQYASLDALTVDTSASPSAGHLLAWWSAAMHRDVYDVAGRAVDERRSTAAAATVRTSTRLTIATGRFTK